MGWKHVRSSWGWWCLPLNKTKGGCRAWCSLSTAGSPLPAITFSSRLWKPTWHDCGCCCTVSGELLELVWMMLRSCPEFPQSSPHEANPRRPDRLRSQPRTECGLPVSGNDERAVCLRKRTPLVREETMVPEISVSGCLLPISMLALPPSVTMPGGPTEERASLQLFMEPGPTPRTCTYHTARQRHTGRQGIGIGGVRASTPRGTIALALPQCEEYDDDEGEG